MSVPRPSYANVMATLAFFFALAGGTFAAVSGIPDKSGKINACYKNKSGVLRVVKQGKKCRKGEKALLWNQKGPTGATGTSASINGVPAGGDLSGTYPGPTIANGVIDTPNFASLPAVRVTNGANQTIGSGGLGTALSFDTELFDTANMHSPGSPTVVTAPVTGIYSISAAVSWEPDTTNRRFLVIVRNSLTALARVTQNAVTGGIDTEQSTSTAARLTAGDTVKVIVVQDSGGPLDAQFFNDDTPVLSVAWIGPG